MPKGPIPPQKIEPVSVLLRAAGRVQGVFFRSEARKKAIELNLSGWIKNEADGSVIALASGEEKAVNRFIDWFRRGPPPARVDNLEITYQKNPPVLPEGFQVV